MLKRSALALLLWIGLTGYANAYPLNCVCPFYNLGPSGNNGCNPGGTCYLYYAYRHTGVSCFQKTQVVYEAHVNAEAACIPAANCTTCINLGSNGCPACPPCDPEEQNNRTASQSSVPCCGAEAEDVSRTTVSDNDATADVNPPGIKIYQANYPPSSPPPFTAYGATESLPVDEASFTFNPLHANAAGANASVEPLKPFTVKVCRDRDCTNTSRCVKYAKIFVFQYNRDYRYKQTDDSDVQLPSASLIGFGFECTEPADPASTKRLMGGIDRAKFVQGNVEFDLPKTVQMVIGNMNILVRVNSPGDWLWETETDCTN